MLAAIPVRLSVIVLVAVNLLPLAGVLFYGWTVFEVVLLFWAENVVIGLMNVARMGTLLTLRRRLEMISLIPFFCVHYGIFTFVHGGFIFGVFGPDAGLSEEIGFFAAVAGLGLPLVALAASHLLSFVFNFLLLREYMVAKADELMTAPYGRVVVLHVTIILGAFAVEALGEPLAALALLVVLKILIDVAAHQREHNKLQRRLAQEESGDADATPRPRRFPRQPAS